MRHAAHYEARLRAGPWATAETAGADPGLGAFRLDWSQIEAARRFLAEAAGEDDDAALRLSTFTEAASAVLLALLPPQLCVEWLREARDVAMRLGEDGRAAGHASNLGTAYAQLGDDARAFECYAQALLTARLGGDRLGEAQDLGGMGMSRLRVHDYHGALDLLESALRVFRQLDMRDSKIVTLSHIGDALTGLGDHTEALARHEQALALCVDGSLRQAAVLCDVVGDVLALGDTERALDLAGRSVTLARTLGDPAGEAAAVTVKGDVHLARREPHQALACYAAALDIGRRLGHGRRQASALTATAGVLVALRRDDEALAAHDEALALARDVGDPQMEHRALCELGMTQLLLGRADEATSSFGEALRIADRGLSQAGGPPVLMGERSSPAAQAEALGGLGDAYAESNRPGEAADCYARAAELLDELTRQRDRMETVSKLARLHAGLGQFDRAVPAFETALDILDELGDFGERGLALRASLLSGLGDALADLGEMDRAIEIYERLLASVRERGDAAAEADVVGEIANVLMSQGEHARALELYGRALEIDRSIGNVSDEIAVLHNMGNVLRATGRSDEAFGCYHRALELARELERPDSEAWVLFGLAQSWYLIGDREQAAAMREACEALVHHLDGDTARAMRAELTALHDEAAESAG